MKNYYYPLLFLSFIILVNIFFIGRIIDILTLGVIVITYFFSRRVSELRKIYFFAAAGCLLFAIVLYYFSTPLALYEIAANWTYAFVAAGAIAMLIEEVKE